MWIDLIIQFKIDDMYFHSQSRIQIGCKTGLVVPSIQSKDWFPYSCFTSDCSLTRVQDTNSRTQGRRGKGQMRFQGIPRVWQRPETAKLLNLDTGTMGNPEDNIEQEGPTKKDPFWMYSPSSTQWVAETWFQLEWVGKKEGRWKRRCVILKERGGIVKLKIPTSNLNQVDTWYRLIWQRSKLMCSPHLTDFHSVDTRQTGLWFIPYSCKYQANHIPTAWYSWSDQT